MKRFPYILPNETRQMIYEYLLTDEVMSQMATCASPTANVYPCHHTVSTYRPTFRFLQLSLGPTVATEIVDAFYCKYRGFEVTQPIRIQDLLCQDFLKDGSSIVRANHSLQALTVSGPLPETNEYCFNINHLASHFSTLLQIEAHLARTFHLNMHLWIQFSDSGHVWFRNGLGKDLALYCTLQTLKPVFAALVKKQPGATYSVVLKYARYAKSSLNLKWAYSASPVDLTILMCDGGRESTLLHRYLRNY